MLYEEMLETLKTRYKRGDGTANDIAPIALPCWVFVTLADAVNDWLDPENDKVPFGVALGVEFQEQGSKTAREEIRRWDDERCAARALFDARAAAQIAGEPISIRDAAEIAKDRLANMNKSMEIDKIKAAYRNHSVDLLFGCNALAQGLVSNRTDDADK